MSSKRADVAEMEYERLRSRKRRFGRFGETVLARSLAARSLRLEPLEDRHLLSLDLFSSASLSVQTSSESNSALSTAVSAETSTVAWVELASTDDVISLQYEVPALLMIPTGESVDGQPVVEAVISGAATGGEAGEPALPVIPVEIVLPYGCTVANIDVAVGDSVTLSGSYVIQQGAQPMVIDPELLATASDGTNGVDVETLEAAASADGFFEVVGVQSERGVNILRVNLNPVDYDVDSGQVTYYSTMTLQVDLTEAAAQASGEEQVMAYRPSDLRPLAEEVANPDALDTYVDAGTTPVALTESICDPADSYEYVAITSQVFAAASTDYSINDLIAQKQSQGMSATVVTLEDIYATYSGVDHPEQIRNFIRDAYTNWETDYVLLGGDSNIVPYRSLWVDLDLTESEQLIPSDMYYQCLDGTYNSDGDSYWGEPTDGPGGSDVDLLPEVYIGRVAAQTTAEMANWVYKAIAYENTASSPYRREAVMVGEYLGFGGISDYATESMEEIRLGSSSAGYTTVGFASDPTFTTTTLYDSSTYTWSTADITSMLNSGDYGIYNHLGHANTSYVMKLGNSNVDALTNTDYFFVYSQGCYPGDFPNDAIAEHLTTSTRTGAAAVVFNSRYGWGTSYSTDSPSQRPNREFWDALFGEGINRLGIMNADSHTDVLWDIADPYIRWAVYETNLFGDPAARIVAQDMSVSDSSPGAGEVVKTPPVDFVLAFSDPYLPSSINSTDFVVNGIAADSYVLTDEYHVTFHFDESPVTAEGTQNMWMAAGAVLRENDGSGSLAWNVSFYYDDAVLQVTSIEPADASAVSPPLTTLRVHVSGVIDPTTVGVDDLTLSRGTVVGAVLTDVDTVEYTLSGIVTEGPLTVDMAGGALTDTDDNPLQPYSGTVTLDYGTTAFPVPLEVEAPLGGLVYDSSIVGLINDAGDTDSFTIGVDAGQAITVAVSPLGLLQTHLRLTGPGGVDVTASAGAGGEDVLLQTVAATAPGTYILTISGVADSAGDYVAKLVLNAAVEEETYSGAANNTLAGAQDLDASMIDLGQGVFHGAVTGITDGLSGAGYAATPIAYDFEDISQTGVKALEDLDDFAFTLNPSDLAGFQIDFYGITYGDDEPICFNTNGLITFGSWTTSYDNTDFTAAPSQAAIAVLWDDLVCYTATDDSGVYWEVLGSGADRRLIVQWNDVDYIGNTSGDITFQAVLYADGRIRLNYADITCVADALQTDGKAATVGIKDAATQGDNRLVLAFNDGPNEYVGTGLSTLIAPLAIETLPDWYSFTLEAGESVSLALGGGGPQATLDLYDSVGLVAHGRSAENLERVISNFVAPAAGTYYVSITGNGLDYSLVVMRNADFETENNDSLADAQDISAVGRVLGHASGEFDTQSPEEVSYQWDDGTHDAALGLPDGGGGDVLALNAFTAVPGGETITEVSVAFGDVPSGTAATLLLYEDPNDDGDPSDAVLLATVDTVVANPNTDLFTTVSMTPTLVQGGFFVGVLFHNQSTGAAPIGLDTTASARQSWVVGHTTQGGLDIVDLMNNDYPPELVDSAVTDGNVMLRATGVPSGDSDYYTISATAGELICLVTTTPGDGSGEFVNTLDPIVELYDPSGVILATNDNGAADGRNALVSFVAPETGTYTVHVLGAVGTSGEYLLSQVRSDVFWSADMSTDPGWSVAGEWAFGQPTGGGGVSFGGPDPTSGFTGDDVYGVDLNGDYDATSGGPWYLTTGPIDCSGYSNVTLQFERWLNTDVTPYVSATIDYFDGTTWINIYTNPSSEVTDSDWQLVSYSLPNAAGNSNVRIRWGYEVTSGAFLYSGWNIDDVALLGVPSEESSHITGYKWNDLDGDGVWDDRGQPDGEPGMVGWTVFVDENGDGVWDQDNELYYAVTDATGYYDIGPLPAGTYVVREVLEPGWRQTYPMLAADYVEDFDDGQAQDWESAQPVEWSVVESKYHAAAGQLGQTMYSAYTGQLWQNCSAEVTVSRSGDAGIASGIVVRATADLDLEAMVGSAYLTGITDSGMYFVGKIVDGTQSFLQTWETTSNLNTGAANTIRMEVIGDIISVYINGNLEWLGTDSSIPAAGYVGLFGYSGTLSQTTHDFDDVEVIDRGFTGALVEPLEDALASSSALSEGDETYRWDDGSSEAAVGILAGDILWGNYFTAEPGKETITSIALAWGAPGVLSPSEGTPCTVLLYDDPDDDGDPSNAILVATASTVVTNAGTDQFTTVPISPTMVDGGFFVAALITQGDGEHPAAMDMTAPVNQAWVAASGTPGGFDVFDLTNNDVSPIRTDALDGLCNFLIRADAISTTSGAHIVTVVAGHTMPEINFGNQMIDVDTTPPVVELGVAEWSDVPTPSVMVTATDTGSGVPDGTLVYLDLDYNNDGDFADFGEMGVATGTLIDGAAVISVSPPLDDGAYHLRARVSDLAGNEGASAVQPIVIDTLPPTDIALSSDSVLENEPVGTVIGNFSTTSLAPGNTFEYTLVSGEGDGDNGLFSIDADGTLRTGESFDFETQTTYSIRVRSTDRLGLWREEAFTIHITDVFGGIYTVTNTNDTGPGSLRQAILDANAHLNDGEVDRIDFAIAGAGLHTIQPLSALPVITEAVQIDGYSQPGSSPNSLAVGDNAVLLVELDGSLAASTNGLAITGGGTSVFGLVINRFAANGIALGDGGDNIIAGSFIGTDASGTVALGNGGYGVLVANNSTGNRIGIDGEAGDVADRNIISGNLTGGVKLAALAQETTVSPSTPQNTYPTALDTYVAAADPNYSYTLETTITGTYAGIGYTGYIYDMISQEWNPDGYVLTNANSNPIWHHWLQIIVPNNLDTSLTTAFLYIGGGSNTTTVPSSVDSGTLALAVQTGTIGVCLPTVPSQPVQFVDEPFNHTEDEILAYSFNKYLETGNTTWIALLPMVKSAVKAMDTAQTVVPTLTSNQAQIEHFVVSGVSKRSWTTQLTTAVDPQQRVVAMMPIVLPLLDMARQIEYQHEYYQGATDFLVDGYTQAMEDYVYYDAFSRFDTPEGKSILQIVDTYAYKDRASMAVPRFYLCGSEDQFFLPGSELFFVDDMQGPTHIRYVPGADHWASDLTSLTAFYSSVLAGVDLPDYDWSITDHGSTLQLTTTTTPTQVRLWQAANPNSRDFRNTTVWGGSSSSVPSWSSQTLSGSGGDYVAHIATPATGATAAFIEFAYVVNGRTIYLTTGVTVVSATASTENSVQGNYIGTTASGTDALANAGDGVLVDNCAGALLAGNLISGNAGNGIRLSGSSAIDTLIQNNYIGTNVVGAALGNSGSGVRIDDGASGNQVGGQVGQGNTIAFNTDAGILVAGTTSSGNSIQANLLFSNGTLAIDLGDDGATVNDVGDADTGANLLQNYPTIDTARPGATTRVSGSLDSTPNTTFTIDFYAGTSADAAWQVNAVRYLAAITVTTDAVGNASFDEILPTATTLGEWVCATATAPDGSTSELSPGTVVAIVGEVPALDFNEYTVGSYDPSQDTAGGYAVEDDGATLRVTGNHWKQIELTYEITPDTVLEFDFQSGVQGEMQGIGFDNDDLMSLETCFQLYGTQTLGVQTFRTYASSAGQIVHYVIPVGKYFTGSMSRLVFVNDDDASNAGESVFSNVKVYEKALAVEVQGTSSPFGISSYGAEDLLTQAFSLEDVEPGVQGFQTVDFAGNSWKKIDLGYTITANTVLEFDFQSTAQGEIQGIGFDNDQTLSDQTFFQLYGTQSWGRQTYRNYASSAGEVVHYVIPVGKYFTGDLRYLVLGCDDDADASGQVAFSNLHVYEPNFNVETQGTSDSYLVTSYGTDDLLTRSMSLDDATPATDGFQSIDFSGNSWKKIDLGYTITANTVLEFDFQSTSQGEIQGIGFDNDQVLSAETFFQLYGTQTWGRQTYDNYASSAGEVVHYVIPVGKYFTGDLRYLVLGCDDDADASGQVAFSNLRVYEPNFNVETQGTSDSYLVTSYGTDDLLTRSMSLEDATPATDGFQSIDFAGNSWKKIDLGYTITANTVLEFDFQSTSQGEIQGIGFDNDQVLSAETFFQLYGTQTWGRQTYRNYAASAGETVHYVIPVGKYFTGDLTYLVLACDADADASGQVAFSNLRVYEPKLDVETQGTSDSYLVTSYGAEDLLTRSMSLDDAASTSDGFQSIDFSGNSWKKIDLGYTITASTVLEFDFQSTAQGEIQGIGFDNDQALSAESFFQLYGTQTWGHQTYHNYASSAGEVVHYVIPIGEYFTGDLPYLILASDDDADASGGVLFSNLRLYEDGGTPIAAMSVSLSASANETPYATTRTVQEEQQESPLQVDPLLVDRLLAQDDHAAAGGFMQRTASAWAASKGVLRAVSRYELADRLAIRDRLRDEQSCQVPDANIDAQTRDRAMEELFGVPSDGDQGANDSLQARVRHHDLLADVVPAWGKKE